MIWFLIGLIVGAVVGAAIAEGVRYGHEWVDWWKLENAPPERPKMDPLDPRPSWWDYYDIAGTNRPGSVSLGTYAPNLSPESRRRWNPVTQEWEVVE